MRNKLLNSFYNFLIVIDYLLISFFFFYFLKLKYNFSGNNIYWEIENIFSEHYKAFFLLLIVWGLLTNQYNFYRNLFFSKLKEIRKTLNIILLFSITVFAISGAKDSPLLSNYLTSLFLFSFFLTSLFFRFFIFLLYNFFLKKGHYLSNVCIIGLNKNTEVVIETLKTKYSKTCNFVGIITKNILKNQKYPIFELNNIEELEMFVKTNNINIVYISQTSDLENKIIDKIINYCLKNHLEFYIIPNSRYGDLTKLEVQYLDIFPILKVRMFPLDLHKNRVIKNILDKLFAIFFCLLFLSWLFPIISLLILIDSKGPILFIQKRNGLNGKEFNCFKFRTMYKTSTNSIVDTKRNDARITKIGKFLRKTSLDEIPQFLNVIKGDMSIVGPRPHMIIQDIHYKKIVNKYYVRHYVKPGITGLAQVKGYRGPIDSNKDMEKRITVDVFYIKNWSIYLDVKIILETVLLMFRGDKNAF